MGTNRKEMSYIRPIDYILHIQDREQQQILSANEQVRKQAELWAISEVRSILAQRWDCNAEFKDTYIWSPTKQYQADDLVYLDADAWSGSVNYIANNLVLYTDKNIYLKNSTTAGFTHQIPTDTTYWTKLGAQYDMFNVIVNAEWYDYNTIYSTGDKVFYKNSYYTAKSQNKNIAPDDKANGSYFWGNPTASTIPTGTLPTDATKWAVGDNRSQIVYNLVIDIAIYRTLMRLAFPQVAKRREKAYEDAMIKLNELRHGNDILEDFPTIQPTQGLRTMMSSNTKNTNIY